MDPPADVRRFDERVDEQDERTGAGECPGGVVASPSRRRPALAQEKRGQRERAQAERMLMKKIHSQPGPSTSGPPISHAAVAPMPPSAPQIPSALFRSAPSRNVVAMIERAVGVMIAAPTPWTTRAAEAPPATRRART